jgi:hypothetical protein
VAKSEDDEMFESKSPVVEEPVVKQEVKTEVVKPAEISEDDIF